MTVEHARVAALGEAVRSKEKERESATSSAKIQQAEEDACRRERRTVVKEGRGKLSAMGIQVQGVQVKEIRERE